MTATTDANRDAAGVLCPPNHPAEVRSFGALCASSLPASPPACGARFPARPGDEAGRGHQGGCANTTGTAFRPPAASCAAPGWKARHRNPTCHPYHWSEATTPWPAPATPKESPRRTLPGAYGPRRAEATARRGACPLRRVVTTGETVGDLCGNLVPASSHVETLGLSKSCTNHVHVAAAPRGTKPVMRVSACVAVFMAALVVAARGQEVTDFGAELGACQTQVRPTGSTETPVVLQPSLFACRGGGPPLHAQCPCVRPCRHLVVLRH